MSFQKINQLAGAAIVHGFADEIIELNEVLAFDLRFNLRHPKIQAIYMLETPINGCHFEVVKRDGSRHHVGGDIAGQILGEEKAYMSNIEQIANQAKEQSGLIKQFCRKCDLFSKLYPEEHQEQQLKERQTTMEEDYLNRAGGVLSRLANADKSLADKPPQISSPAANSVSAGVSGRIRTKLRTNCEIQYAVAQEYLPSWIEFLHDKRGQVLGKGEIWTETDPTGILRFEARGGKIILSREGTEIGAWNSYESAHRFLRLGANSLPNPVLPLTKNSYERTVAAIPADEALLRPTIRAQVTASICDPELWDFLNE